MLRRTAAHYSKKRQVWTSGKKHDRAWFQKGAWSPSSLTLKAGPTPQNTEGRGYNSNSASILEKQRVKPENIQSQLGKSSLVHTVTQTGLPQGKISKRKWTEGSAEPHLKDSQITISQVGKYFTSEFGWYLETQIFTEETPVHPHQPAMTAALLHAGPKEQSPQEGSVWAVCNVRPPSGQKKREKKAVVLLPPFLVYAFAIFFFASEETTLSGYSNSSGSGICC